MHLGQHEKHPPVNTWNVETTISQRICSVISGRYLHTVSDLTGTFCFCTAHSISGNKMIKHYSDNDETLYNDSTLKDCHFCGWNTYCSDSVCFSSCLDFLWETKREDQLSDDQKMQPRDRVTLWMKEGVNTRRARFPFLLERLWVVILTAKFQLLLFLLQ